MIRSSLLACGFYIYIRLNSALDLTVGLLKFLNAVPDQYKNMAVDGAALIIRNKSELFQHLFLNANRYTFCSHSNLRIFRYIMALFYVRNMILWYIWIYFISIIFVRGVKNLELQAVLSFIRHSSDDTLYQIMRSIERRYADVYPDWDVLYIAVHKDPKLRKAEIAQLITFLEKDTLKHLQG